MSEAVHVSGGIKVLRSGPAPLTFASLGGLPTDHA